MNTFGGPLNLSDADTSGFSPLDPGRYNAEVFAVNMDAVKNTRGTGKMPAGTPMIKVQFKVTDEGVNNRRVFATYVIPPADYDVSKASRIKGMLVNFLVAIGESEDAVKSSDYSPDLEDFVGRECVVVVGKENKRTSEGTIIEDEWNNPVKGVKPAGSLAGSATSGGIL